MSNAELRIGKVIEIGFVVADLDRCVQLFESVPGVGRFSVYRSIEMFDVRLNGVAGEVNLDVAMGVVGGMVVELIQQNDLRQSPFQPPAGASGPTFNHWSMFVPQFDDALAQYVARDYQVAFQATFRGESHEQSSRIAYLHRGSPSEAYIEIMEATPPLSALYAELLEAPSR